METPLTNQAIFGLGSPPTRQVRIPVSFGARIRFLGALTQNGAAVMKRGISTLQLFTFLTSCKWWGQCCERSSTALRHNGCVPFTLTLMMWCAVPRRFVAVQRYSPASVSTTSEILSVFWKVWKDILPLGSSPPSFCQEISGVGLSLSEIQTQVLTFELIQLFFSCSSCSVLTYKPSAMHCNSRVSPLRTILVLVVPIGYMNSGLWSPAGLSEGTRTLWHHKQKTSLFDIQRIWNISSEPHDAIVKGRKHMSWSDLKTEKEDKRIPTDAGCVRIRTQEERP